MMQADVSCIIAEDGKSAIILVTHDTGEAIAMADRVLVLTTRPATVRALNVIDLPRADRRSSSAAQLCCAPGRIANICADLGKPAGVV